MTHTNPHPSPSPIVIPEEPGADPPEPAERQGFLPIETNWFDRLFIGVVIWVAASLLWFRFIEPLGPSIWISNVFVLALAAFIVRRG